MEVILFQAGGVGEQNVVVRLTREAGRLIVGQRDGDGAGGAVGVGDREVGVFAGAGLVPSLGGDGPAGQDDWLVGTVSELQRHAVVRPALQADVVGAGRDSHAAILAASVTEVFTPTSPGPAAGAVADAGGFGHRLFADGAGKAGFCFGCQG